MLSVAPAAGSTEYYDDDDYYVADEHGLSSWAGSGAEALGLRGEVAQTDYQRLYDGTLPDGTRLGTQREGRWQHYPGWDLTFSSPKSVSLLAEVAGDRRLIAAHDQAVREALAWIEREAAMTRIRHGDRIEHVRTGNLVVAVYRHDLSRAQEPQLHSHAVVMNATRDGHGKWRSLDGRAFFRCAKEGGIRYQQALARRVRELGYEILPHRNGTFEIAGVPREVIERFSSRAKAIEARLAAKGLDRQSASTLERKDAAVKTRQSKRPVDRDVLMEAWRQSLHEAGVDLDGVADAARDRGAQPERQATLEQEESPAAIEAVRTAAEKLVERNAVFAQQELELEAGILAFGKADANAIQRAIRHLAEQKELLPRHAEIYRPETGGFEATDGWTTAQAVQAERAMLAVERAGREAMGPAMALDDAKAVVAEAMAVSRAAGFDWTLGQRVAAEGLLASRHRVTAVQGYAGTAKTTTVLATYAGALRAENYWIEAMAPTLSAAEGLGKAIGGEGITVHRHLANLRQAAGKGHDTEQGPASQSERPQAWIVDEASMVSAKIMRDLLRAAEDNDARIVLVGDVKQLGSVEAGRAFGQLQESGMVTYRLAEIVRQSNRPLKEAIHESLRADAAAALERLDHGGGQVIEIAAQNDKKAERARAWQDRLGAIADRYVELSQEDRERTIVIEPSREGRAQLNAAIRDRLADRGELVGAALAAEVLTAKGLTKAEAKLALSYEPGDVVRFERAYKPKEQPAIAKDEYLEVMGTNPEAGQVTLAKGDGSRVLWEPNRWGGTRSEAYRRESRELRAGDTITWTRNIKELDALNGRTERVAAVDPARGVALLERGADKPIELDLRANHSRHWDHGYARTVHSAQGQTADRVFAHVESHRANLVHQRSFYVSISRAKEQALVVTDSRQKLIEAVQERSGAKMAALDGVRQVGRAAESAAQAAATTRTASATNAAVRSTTRTMGFGLER